MNRHLLNQRWRLRALAAAAFAGPFALGATVAVGAPAPVAPLGPFASEVVALPPFEFDAAEPPWVRDTRTANTTIVLPRDEVFFPLVDALRALPGVQIGQPGGPGGRSSLYLRGGEDNYTEVLLDGVPVNNSTESTGGGFDFGTLDASEFAAVAVVPGPVSARYGPDALSGVIKLTSLVMGVPDSRVAMQGGGKDWPRRISQPAPRANR